MVRLYVIFLIHTSFLFRDGETNVYSSVIKMESLARVEQQMLKGLYKYIQDCAEDESGVPDSIKGFYDNSIVKNKHCLEEDYMTNPINAFHFVKRMYYGWSRILTEINCVDCIQRSQENVFNEYIEQLNRESRVGTVATEDDYKGSALGLVRLWQTYKLDLKLLYRGIILDKTMEPLSVEDVVAICIILDDHNKFYNEIIWLEALRESMGLHQVQVTSQITTAKVTKLLSSAYSKYGWPWISVQLLERMVDEGSANDATIRDMEFYKQKLAVISDHDRASAELRADQEDLEKGHYEALCRGDVQRPIKLTSQLRCFNRVTSIPIFRAKEEVLSIDPRISLFYNVTTETQRHFMKESVYESLGASLVFNDDGSSRTDNKIRVSQTAWIPDWDDARAHHISRNVEIITGLSTQMFEVRTHAESLQILNYGIGGMYEKHCDYLESNVETGYLANAGDRLATWMFYLSDVESGGSTVFTRMNITIPVVKGAAAFWLNLKRTGEPDDRTQHAGCPVLLGSKWVANKWLRERGQMFRRKCGLTPTALDDYL